MYNRVFEILTRLDSIGLETRALRNELHEILSRTKSEWMSDEQPDFSMFKDTTQRLLREFWKAPDRILTQKDLQRVMFDPQATEEAIRSMIKRARQEMRGYRCCYEIVSISKKRYRLVETQQIVSKPTVSNPKKSQKTKGKT